MTEKRMCLVRHGETYANIQKVWHGSTDTQLTDNGHKQRGLLGQYFSNYMAKPDVVIASPLQRATLTAESIAHQYGLDVVPEEGIKEHCVGEWEGYDFTKLHEELNVFQSIRDDADYRTPGGESRKEVTQRVVAVVEKAWELDAENIVLVAHGLAWSYALMHFFGDSATTINDFHMDNTAVTEIDLARKKIINFNQTRHLQTTANTSGAVTTRKAS